MEEKKKRTVSRVIKIVFPLMIIIDVSFLVSLIYGSVNGYSVALMRVLVATAFLTYHITIRPITGRLIGYLRPILDLKLKKYEVRPWEVKIYEKLKIRSWKGLMPFWDHSHFELSVSDAKDIDKVSWVLRYNISAEITHTINFFIGFLSILLCIFKVAREYWWALLIGSFIISMCADFPFILMQRYNRSRVLPLYHKLAQRANIQDKKLIGTDVIKLEKIEIKIKKKNIGE